jgi:uracil-DNA glycosylase
MNDLLNQIRSCVVCEAHLPFPPRPIVQASSTSKIIIVGQAPGAKVQSSGVPWDDASGKELRRWLAVTEEQFYDPNNFGLIPMGFCYPGKGRSGDLPPRPECAPLWHERLLNSIEGSKLIILVGLYAQTYYLGNDSYRSVTDNVRNFRQFLPQFLPTVHPSPRNRIWQKKNEWFERELIPELRNYVHQLLV